MVDLTFDKADLERLVVDDWQLVCGRWKQVGVIGQWLTIKGDGLDLSGGVKNNPLWRHSAGDKVLPLPKFTLTQFKAFCDWHPTFEWEAITSVFTNDDGTLDVVALAELESRGRAACALVRGVLVGPDDEYLKAWEADCRVDECKTEIAALKKLKPVSITERMFAKQELETLEARLAELLKPTTDPASPVAEPAPQVGPVVQPEVTAIRPKAKRRTWWDVSSLYIVGVMAAGQYGTGKELYRALEAKAGPESPFDKGQGTNRGCLFVREIAQSLSMKTVQNKFGELRALAQKVTP